MARILIIDDDRSLLELLSGYLERQGYEVATASSGQVGLTTFAESGADLVLLDVTMHGLDGWQVLARFREQSSVPIIMITARSDEPEVLRGFSGGADDYVSKPIRPEDLLRPFRCASAGCCAAPYGAPYGACGCNSLATSAVQPVWWLAPIPAPLSPWKYS